MFSARSGDRLAESGTAYQINNVGFDCSGPALADLDGDGRPEIIAGGMVARWNKAMGRIDVLWSKPAEGGTWGVMSLVNDMDGDGKPEVVTGTRIFDGLTGADKSPPSMAALTVGGYAAIGDFNQDGWPDLVFIQSHRRIRPLHPTCTFL